MNIVQHLFVTTGLIATLFISTAVSANSDLLWPIDCKPGDDSCFSTIGYPDADADGLAHDCGAPGYFGHEGTDISVYPSAIESGVDVLAADEGEVLFVFDGHDDDCTQGGVGQGAEQWGQKGDGGQHDRGRDQGCERGPSAGGVVHRGS